MTPTAWTSFATGMNPGQHGLFDFTGRKPDSYETYLVNSTYRASPPLWLLLSRQGKRVIVFNVPVTYPPDKVNGLMVSGLLTPASAKDATWPPELQQELHEAVPEFNFSPPGMHSRSQNAEFVQTVRALIGSTLKATRYMMDRQPWDLLVTVFMSTDIMSHYMWGEMEAGASSAPQPLRDGVTSAVQDCYRDADTALAELLEAAGPETVVIVMSDHGFGPLDQYMSVNAWLIEQGYIHFKRSLPSRIRYGLYRAGITPLAIFGLLLKLGLGEPMRRTSRKNIGLVARVIQSLFPTFRDVDWSRTTAYSNGFFAPITVNLKGREPMGIVAPGAEYEALLTKITGELRQLREPGTDLPFVGEIHRGRTLYSGSSIDAAPDLVFMPRDPRTIGVGLVEFATNRWLSPSPDRSGSHRMDGILFMTGPGVRRGVELTGASIMDIAPTVLALLGAPIPRAMDGRVLEGALDDDLRGRLEIAYSQQEAAAAEVGLSGMTAEDEELIRARLRDLGYVA